MEIKFETHFVCPANIAHHLQRVFHGEYDLRLSLPWGSRILDLGANCGAFSVWATHRWPGCSISAYEPHPKTFDILKKNTEHYPNITVNNWGIGKAGFRVLSEGKHNCGESSFHEIENNPTPTGVHCEVRDPFSLPDADVLKMDIEGCEMEVLEPLIKGGRKFDLILLEWHNHRLRLEVDRLLETDYVLVGAEVQHIGGRGVSKYAHKDLIAGMGYGV